MSEHATDLQLDIIKSLGTRPLIDPEQEVRRRVDFLADYLSASGSKGFVLGISGGQDSSLAGRLAQLAVAKTRPAEFYALRLPYGCQVDEEDAQKALRFISPDHTLNINIKESVDALSRATAGALGRAELGDFNRGNLKARMRMAAHYAVAGEHGLLVLGTDHAAENLTGFFTKFGDGAADLLPLAGLTKGQGAQMLSYLQAPAALYEKVPTADLEDERPALPDEEALGVSYYEVDAYLEGRGIDKQARERIEYLWRVGQHKRHHPPGPDETWWR